MRRARRIYWVDQDRFDVKPDRSTWIETAQVLSDCGYRVEILTWGPSGYQPEGDVRIRYFRAFDALWLFRTSLLLNILAWLIRHSSRDDVIIIHPDGLYIAPVLRLMGRRNIHLDVRTVPVEVNSFKRRLDRLLYWKLPMRFLRGAAGGQSFITRRLKEMVEEEFGVTVRDFSIWSSGVNTRRFSRETKATGSDGRQTLFYHGTISKDRGIDRVVLALAGISEDLRRRIRFVLVGDGPDAGAIRRLASDLGLSELVHFAGKHPYEAIPAMLADASVCICPLPARPEWNVSSPIKVFEFMAAGRPMILTPIAAHLDVAKSRDFVVWTKGDQPEDYREAIERAFANLSALTEAAKSAAAVARDSFDWSVQGRYLADYLDRKFGLCREKARAA
jgi:glycosyltransferase involved in cell wall biosynthesis